MRQKVSNYEIKKRFILYKGHTGWKIKTRIFGSLIIGLSAFTFAENIGTINVHAADATSVETQATGGTPTTVPAGSTTPSKPTVETSNGDAAGKDQSTDSTEDSMVDTNKGDAEQEQPTNYTAEPTKTVQEKESAPEQGQPTLAKPELMRAAAVPNAELTAQPDTTQTVDTAAATADKYPVLSPDKDVNVGVDTTQVELSAKEIANHFTATVENRDGGDNDDDPADNIVKIPIGADGTVKLTSNDPHTYYTSPGNPTSITGHQAAHVSFEHEIDFNHNFSMSGALGIGSKTSGGADSVGFIFAPGDPSKATQGGSGGKLGLQGLDDAFGFVFDEFDNRNDYNDPEVSSGGLFPRYSFSPYVGWRTTGADGKLQKTSDSDWKKTSNLTLNRSQGNTLNEFTLDYTESTKTLTVKLGGQTFTKTISDVSSGYSISVAASTGGSWNDYSARIDDFKYTPKTIPLNVNLVDDADQDALLNKVNVSAVANIGDTISIFSTQEAADRAVKEDHLDPSLVAVIPTDSAGNIYVIDGDKSITDETGTVKHIGGDTTVGDGTYYSYTVKDGDGQNMIVPVRLAYKAVVTPVDSKTGQKIDGLDPVTVVAVAGKPSLVQIPGYTTTKVTLTTPAEGQAVAQDTLAIDQGNTVKDPTTTTADESNPIGHYYTGNGKTVDGHDVVTKATVGTGKSVADDLNKQPLDDPNGNLAVSGQDKDSKPITNTDYYWSSVGNATATDSTDETTPKDSGSVLVPTASTLDYWKGVAADNQTKADKYKKDSQAMYDKFVGITGLTQAQKDDADALLKSVVDIYANVSDKNGKAKTAFENAGTATDATTIYNDGQDGYASLEEVQNLLVKFNDDLGALTTKNDDVKSSLATFKSPDKHYTYGDEIDFPPVSFGEGFGTVTDDQVKGFDNPDYYKYYDTNDTGDKNPIQTPKDVGSYIFKLTDAGRTYLKSLTPDNLQAGLYVSAILTIDPKKVTASVNDATVTYGGDENKQMPAFSGSIDGTAADSSDFEVTDASGKTVSVDKLQVGGNYTISYTQDAQTKLKANKNYDFTDEQGKSTFGTGTLTVEKRKISVTANDHNKTYGTTDDPTLDLTSKSADGLVNGDDISDLNVHLTRAEGENAGEYKITGTGSSDNYDVTVNSGTFTIAKKPVSVNVKSQTITYGDSIPDPTFTYDNSSLVGKDTVDALGVNLTNPTGIKDVGTYQNAITGTANDSGNYAVTINPGILIINPKEVTVKASDIDKTYGNDDPALTLEDPSSVLVGDDKVDALHVKLTREGGDTVKDGGYQITGKQIETGNYEVTVEPGTFTIKKRPVTVTINNPEITYGDDIPTPTFKITNGNLVGNDKNTDLGVKLSDISNIKNVGSYKITGSTSDTGNYAVKIIDGTLKIDQKKVTVTANNAGKTYGNEDPELTLKDPTDVLASGDTVDDLNIKLKRTIGEDQGEYPIKGIIADPTKSSNYDVTVNPGKFSISKKNVTVTIDDSSMTYGDKNIPKPTFKITDGSLVNGDIEGKLGVTLINPTNVKDATDYKITGTTTDTGNYKVEIIDGKLTVNPKAVTVMVDPQTKVYGEKDP